MKSPLFIAAMVAAICAMSGTGHAQARRHIRPPIAKYQPYTSPYLGMLGPGGAAYGYFAIAQPQEQYMNYQYNFNRSFMDFENQVNKNFNQAAQQIQQTQQIRRTIGTTGHRTGFMNSGGYFPSTGR
jgi:hypothetical protein